VGPIGFDVANVASAPRVLGRSREVVVDPPPEVIHGSREVLACLYLLSARSSFGQHRHGEHQLAWAASGTVYAEVGSTAWVLPPSLGLWIPGDLPHDVSAISDARLHIVYFHPSLHRIDAPWDRPVVVGMPPLLRELVSHLCDPAVVAEERRLTQGLLLAALAPAPRVGVDVPMPLDDRALSVADALLRCPEDERTLAAWGQAVGASSRTLARLFRLETGMSFAEWRTQARMRASLLMLADGTPATLVARAVGYANPSAFSVAFHRRFGRPPSRYFEERYGPAAAVAPGPDASAHGASAPARSGTRWSSA
jgi:AraC-like DNA-binding protein/quercetin dioxygenase-like cupin family protein